MDMGIMPMDMCGGECTWKRSKCASPQHYSPYHWLYGNGGMPRKTEPIKPLRPRLLGRGRGAMASRTAELYSIEKAQRINAMAAAQRH